MEARIIFANQELRDAFRSLKNKDQRLHKEIIKALESIRQNVFFGRNVKKKLIPRNVLQKYRIDNLWIYNLRKDWRLLYTITNNQIEVLAIVLDWMNHKDYERLFHFN